MKQFFKDYYAEIRKLRWYYCFWSGLLIAALFVGFIKPGSLPLA